MHTVLRSDLKITEAAAALGVSVPTIYEMIRDKRLKAYRLGERSQRITRESFEALRNGEVAAHPLDR